MNFQNELFKKQDEYSEKYGYPDIVFVRYDVWCEMFPLGPFTPGKGVNVGGSRYIALPTCDGPMFQFCDRKFMDRAFSVIDPFKTDLVVLTLLDETEGRIADWNPNYCTPEAVPQTIKTRTISIELMKRWKESF